MYAFRSYNMRTLCAKNCEDRFQMLYVIEENITDIFEHMVHV